MHRNAQKLRLVEGGVSESENLVECYLLDCKSRNLSPCTIKLNTIVLREFFVWFGSGSIRDVTSQDLKRFLVNKSEKASKATAKRYHNVLSPFFKFVVAEGILDHDPMARVAVPKAPVPVIKPLSALEATALVEAVTGNGFIHSRNRALILLMLDSGLRASEVCSLTLEDIDLRNQVLYVRHGKGDKPRVCPFGNTTARTLRQYLAERSAIETEVLIVTCYGDPVDRHCIRNIVERLALRAGLGHVNPHRLRHSFAVSFLRNGGDAFSLQRLLGHSTLAMTRRYSELADSDVIAKHRLYSPADNLSLGRNIKGRKRIR
ncbi:MAG: tyrosine-type recombinase/integrase [Armatimonadetes bacterium]|nr:tyrosine-type recombinase/integrase [Armatimonadota bacterium]